MPRFTRLCILLLIGIAVRVPSAAQEYRGITLLYTNDIHDHLLPFSYPDPPNNSLGYSKMKAIKNIGGVARIATLIDHVRQETKGNTLAFDAGDLLEGTPLTIEYHGAADFAALSAAGYNAFVLGNHDLQVSLDQLHKNISMASFPVVCANVIDRRTGKLLLPPYAIFTVQDVKIAVLGVTADGVADGLKAVKEGLTVTDPVAAAREYVPKLREQADLVVILSHMGVGEDKKLAKDVPGIDVIFGGHSHSWQKEPILVKNRDWEPFRIDGTISAYCYEHGGELGRLNLRLRKNNGRFEIMGFDGGLIPVTADIPDDPKTANVIDRYYKPIAHLYDEVVGEAADTFFNDRAGENTMLNLICDAMKEVTGSQVAVFGEAGCRGDVIAGPVKVWDLSLVMPNPYKMVTMRITGARLKEHLALRIPGVSAGMKYKVVGATATESPRKGQRVGTIAECTLDGKPIDDNAMYTLTTHEWFLQLFFKDITDAKILDLDCRGAVAEYFRRHKVVSPVRDGRRDVERGLLG